MAEIKINSCEHWVYPTNDWGKLPKRKCDKLAVVKDTNGRHLCQNHFNRWEKKVNKHHLITENI